MEKKSERIEVRVGYQEKIDFANACELQGDTPSGAVRRFINGYVKRADGDILASAWRNSARRRLPKMIGAVVVLAVLGLAGWASYAFLNQKSDAEIFAMRDFNNDGQLNGRELAHAEVAAEFLRVMDLDNSGGLDKDEFQSRGDMLYVLSGPKNSPQHITPLSAKESVVMVKFQIEPERIKSGTYSVAGELKDLDRVVFWHEGGGITVMEGPVDIDLSQEYITNSTP